VAFAHHHWCRRHAPPTDSKIFSRFDKRDVSASLLLIGSLVAAFCALRSGIWLALGAAATPTFNSAQTVIITTAAAGIMILGYLQRNKELRNIAILVTLIGMGKVFFHDLLLMNGMPLVIGIFSFGLTAAVQSVVLGRWQSRSAREEQAAAPAAEAAAATSMKEATEP